MFDKNPYADPNEATQNPEAANAPLRHQTPPGLKRAGEIAIAMALVCRQMLKAFTNPPISAQVSGYVTRWYFDIGSLVRQNQVLAQIDPRTCQAALDQAKGALARDSATLANARIDRERYRILAAQNAISNRQLATPRDDREFGCRSGRDGQGCS